METFKCSENIGSLLKTAQTGGFQNSFWIIHNQNLETVWTWRLSTEYLGILTGESDYYRKDDRISSTDSASLTRGEEMNVLIYGFAVKW